MILQSSKLSGLGLVADQSQPELDDHNLRVAPVMLDSVAIPFPLQQINQPANGTSTVAEMRTSFINGYSRDLAAAGGLEATRLAVLLQGLWHFRCYGMAVVPATCTQFTFFMQYGDEDVALSTVPLFHAFGNTVIQEREINLDFWLTIPKRNRIRFETLMNNTGGATVMRLNLGWVANRYA